MNPAKLFPVVALALVGLVIHAQDPVETVKTTKKASRAAHATVAPAASAVAPADGRTVVYQGDAKLIPRMMRRAEGSYEVVFDTRIAPPLWTTTRFQTSITLPNGERVWKANASDDDDWEVTWVKKSNLVFVKPFFPNATTAVNVITYSGNHYTFKATSDTANGGNEPMLMLDVLPPAWMKAQLQRQQESSGKQGGSPKGRSGAIAGPGEGPGDTDEDLVPASEVEKARRQGIEVGTKAGEDKAMIRRDDELREYAYSIFHNANENYKWSGDSKELRLKKVFDDGRVTYLIFESALNIMPAFWEIDGGERKDVRAQRPTFASDLVIVGKLFKEGTLSIGPKVEVKITNRGWVAPTAKAQINSAAMGAAK